MRNKLPILRAERGWSQADLAAQLGVSRQTVNAIEKERYDPSLPLAFKLAEVFGTPIEQIFEPDRDGSIPRGK
jgi:putative transcriptional regulator